MKKYLTALLTLCVSLTAMDAQAEWKLASSMTNPKIFSKINLKRCSYRLGFVHKDLTEATDTTIYVDLGNTWVSKEAPGTMYLFESPPLIAGNVMLRAFNGAPNTDPRLSIMIRIGQQPDNHSLSIADFSLYSPQTDQYVFQTQKFEHFRKMFLESNCG